MGHPMPLSEEYRHLANKAWYVHSLRRQLDIDGNKIRFPRVEGDWTWKFVHNARGIRGFEGEEYCICLDVPWSRYDVEYRCHVPEEW